MSNTLPAQTDAPRSSSATGKFLYMSRADVERSGATLDELEREIHAGFREKGRGRIESPPKRGVLPRPDASIRAMKAFVPHLGTAGVKWISAFPENAKRGLPTISGVIVLNEPGR